LRNKKSNLIKNIKIHMQNIVVLIDFTEGSVSALQQAVAIAIKTNSMVTALHVVPATDKTLNATTELKSFVSKHVKENFEVETAIAVGSLNGASKEILTKIKPDLVIICTHGVKGMFQYLFGAQILKLVNSIPFPCLVIHENNQTDFTAIKEILFPIGPHPDFITKIKQTTSLAKLLNLEVIIYKIDKPGIDFDAILSTNETNAVKYFDENNIPYKIFHEDVEIISVGYSRQTLAFAKNNKISVMSLMANVSNNDVTFGYGDKESFLVNEEGISVLSCN
jgi:nucleotide-binding universal stress UspA family protein